MRTHTVQLYCLDGRLRLNFRCCVATTGEDWPPWRQGAGISISLHLKSDYGSFAPPGWSTMLMSGSCAAVASCNHCLLILTPSTHPACKLFNPLVLRWASDCSKCCTKIATCYLCVSYKHTHRYHFFWHHISIHCSRTAPHMLLI